MKTSAIWFRAASFCNYFFIHVFILSVLSATRICITIFFFIFIDRSQSLIDPILKLFKAIFDAIVWPKSSISISTNIKLWNSYEFAGICIITFLFGKLSQIREVHINIFDKVRCKYTIDVPKLNPKFVRIDRNIPNLPRVSLSNYSPQRVFVIS